MAKTSTTQSFIPIKEVRDGVIVLKNGSLRVILLASAINISLKSQEEQEALVYQFQDFLNSLDFPIQISVQSRRYDIRPYLEVLERRIEQQTEDLLRLQTREYIGFIKWFTGSVNIMSKKFYVVIPYTGGSIGKKSSGLFDGHKKTASNNFDENAQKFEEQRSQIEQRIAIVKNGLSRVGVRSEQLNTQQTIEVFHSMFNPGDSHRNIPEVS